MLHQVQHIYQLEYGYVSKEEWKGEIYSPWNNYSGFFLNQFFSRLGKFLPYKGLIDRNMLSRVLPAYYILPVLPVYYISLDREQFSHIQIVLL